MVPTPGLPPVSMHRRRCPALMWSPSWKVASDWPAGMKVLVQVGPYARRCWRPARRSSRPPRSGRRWSKPVTGSEKLDGAPGRSGPRCSELTSSVDGRGGPQACRWNWSCRSTTPTPGLPPKSDTWPRSRLTEPWSEVVVGGGGEDLGPVHAAVGADEAGDGAVLRGDGGQRQGLDGLGEVEIHRRGLAGVQGRRRQIDRAARVDGRQGEVRRGDRGGIDVEGVVEPRQGDEIVGIDDADVRGERRLIARRAGLVQAGDVGVLGPSSWKDRHDDAGR